ncbi:MAG TPA: hypothetical protein PKX00_04135 [Opitutaceae bacterium]|nr:hypothetical protein [Opitutaceae bacterium]
MPKSTRRLSHDQNVFLHALLAGLPGVVVSMAYLWGGDQTPKEQWTLSLLILSFWLGFAASVRAKVVRPLQTMANLLSALREGDFSIRARGARRDEPLGDVLAEINTLGGVLQEQRLGALKQPPCCARSWRRSMSPSLPWTADPPSGWSIVRDRNCWPSPRNGF